MTTTGDVHVLHTDTRGGAPRLPEGSVATHVLRLLSDDPVVDLGGLDWSEIRAAGERNHLMIRLADALKRRDIPVSSRFAEAAEQRRIRAARMLALSARIGEACKRLDIPHVFLKLAEHYPDVGRDIDLLVGTTARDVDDMLLDHVPAIARPRRLDHRLSGATTFTVPTYDVEIDILHGRLGRLGQQTREAELLLRRRQLTRLGSAICSVPSPEDQLLLRALGQFSRLPCLRLTDVHGTISVVRAGRLDWDALVAEANATGLLPSLSCHLDYVDQIHQSVFRRPLLDHLMWSRLPRGRWGRVAWRNGGYRFSAIRVSGPIYVKQLSADMRLGDWPAAARMLLAPLAAGAATWRRVKRRLHRRS